MNVAINYVLNFVIYLQRNFAIYYKLSNDLKIISTLMCFSSVFTKWIIFEINIIIIQILIIVLQRHFLKMLLCKMHRDQRSRMEQNWIKKIKIQVLPEWKIRILQEIILNFFYLRKNNFSYNYDQSNYVSLIHS